MQNISYIEHTLFEDIIIYRFKQFMRNHLQHEYNCVQINGIATNAGENQLDTNRLDGLANN